MFDDDFRSVETLEGVLLSAPYAHTFARFARYIIHHSSFYYFLQTDSSLFV